MRKIILIPILLAISLLTLTNCDKEKKAAKKLEGTWELVQFSKTDWEGMTEYPSSLTGKIMFDDYTADSSTYTLQVSAIFDSSNGNMDQNGSYKMTEKGNYMYVSTLDAQGSVTSYYKYRILTLNSTDLQLEFTSIDGYYHMMIFRKK